MRNKSVERLLKPPANIASGISTKFLPENPIALCDRLKLLLQDKQTRNTSNIINEKKLAIAAKLFEYKCLSTKQHTLWLVKCLN